MKTTTIFILFAMVAISCSETEEKAPEDFDYGSIEENVYTNDFFDLKISYPSEWVVQDQEQVAQMKAYAEEVISGEDEVLKSAIKASEINSAYLLTLFKHELGAPVDYNPNLVVVAENIQLAPGIKQGKDYLFHSKKIMQQSQMEYSFDKEIYNKKIGTVDFDVLDATLFYIGQTILQEYFCTIRHGFSLVFIISYTTESEQEELYSILNNISI